MGNLPGFFMLGRQRTSAGLSQKIFVKRYHWLFGLSFSCLGFPHFHGPLSKAVHFLFQNAKTQKERLISK